MFHGVIQKIKLAQFFLRHGVYTVFRRKHHSRFLLYLHGECLDLYKIFRECLRNCRNRQRMSAIFQFQCPEHQWLTRCKHFDVKYCESDNLLCKYLHLNKIQA